MLTTSILRTATLAVALREARDFITKYVVVTEDQATTLALWIAHTHAIAAFDTTPYLQITSATKRAGKTRLLETLETVVARPWLTGRTSAAALVRMTDAEAPTLLLDESDAAFNGEREYVEALRGILNCGYKRSGNSSICVGKSTEMKVRKFCTFGPKAIAGIGKLPDTVADRAIPIQLRRKTSSEPVARWRDRDGRAEGMKIQQKLAAWATNDTVATLRDARPTLPDSLSDRAQDVWEPLLAIAEEAAGDWPASARRAAVALMGTVEDEDPTIQLLSDLAEIVTDADVDVIPSQQIIERLVARDDRPWATWRHDRPITARGLARMLAPLGIHPVRLERVRGYRHDAFSDAINRYLPGQASLCHRTSKSSPEPPDGFAICPTARDGSCDAVSPIDAVVADAMTLAAPHSQENTDDALF